MPDEIECPACRHNKGEDRVGFRNLSPFYEEWVACALCKGTGIASANDYLAYRFLFGHASGKNALPDNKWPPC
jgi:hypothetical protein